MLGSIRASDGFLDLQGLQLTTELHGQAKSDIYNVYTVEMIADVVVMLGIQNI